MKFQQVPWKHDPRSEKFSYETLFGAGTPILPDTLNRPRGPVLDQGPTLRCTGYGSAANGYYIHGFKMNPDWSAAKIGEKQGKSVDTAGADPNACMKHQRDDGFLAAAVNDQNWLDDGIKETGYGAWPAELEFEAKRYDTISGFASIRYGYIDLFDATRRALFESYDPETKRGPCVDVFSRWLDNWNTGEIPSAEGRLSGYHRHLAIDTERTHKDIYIVTQNSYGTGYGDGGFHYWNRAVWNREMSMRGCTLKILATLTPAQIAEARKETPLGAFIRSILHFWYA